MKRLALTLAAALAVASASALPKAIYVKQGDEISKYNFGVAEDLVFSDNGTKLTVKGYGETIDLNAIDYISFSAPLGSALTPSAQKQKLVDTGQEAYSLIDLNDQADILKMSHDFFDAEENGNDYIAAPVSYWLDPDWYDVHGEFRNVVKAVVSLLGGDASAARSVKAGTVNLYKLEDYFGIYTADKATEKWVKTPADHLEVRFGGRDGSNYVWRLDASDDFTTWNTRDFNGRFPRKINVTVSKNDAVLATVAINTVLKQSESIDMTLDVEANGYVVHNVMNVTDNLITDNVSVTIKGTSYLTAATTASGRNFVNYNVMYDAIKAANGYEDGDDWVEGDAADLVACFTRVQTDVDLMGKLQVKGKIAAPSKIHSTLTTESDYGEIEKDGLTIYTYGKVIKRDGTTIHTSWDNRDVYEIYAKCLNDYTDAGFYYDGNKTLQGYLGLTCGEEIEDDWVGDSSWSGYTIIDGMLVSVSRDIEDYDAQIYGPWHYSGYNEQGNFVKQIVADADVIHPSARYCHYYNIEPLLLFPDGTSFAAETFFDEISFSRLIDDYNEIIDTYLSITGQTPRNDEH